MVDCLKKAKPLMMSGFGVRVELFDLGDQFAANRSAQTDQAGSEQYQAAWLRGCDLVCKGKAAVVGAYFEIVAVVASAGRAALMHISVSGDSIAK